jgi:hypothetical protein
MWLADYVISNDMDAAYRQATGDGTAPAAPPEIAPLPSDVKDQIDAEVQRDLLQLQHERDQQAGAQPINSPSGSLAETLSDRQTHTFVAGAEVTVVDSTRDTCELTPGDSVMFSPPPPAQNASTVDVTVVWSKGGQDCQTGKTLSVSIEVLQEMQTSMLATVDEGLDKLRAQQFRGRIPPAPPGASGPTFSPAFANAAPGPDSNAPAEVNSQSQEADRAEQSAPKP